MGERLNVNWNVDNSLAETEVPALCLQPLVENAIYHGIEPLADGGIISISAKLKNNKLELCVSNPLDNGAMSRHRGNHMAQENINQRLNLVYGKNASFSIKQDTKTYAVILEIPLET